MVETLKREDVEARLKWNLAPIMDEGDIERYFKEIKEGAKTLASYAAKFSKENALEVLRLESEISKKLERLYIFVHLKSDEDKSNAKYLELTDRVGNLSVALSEAASYINPSMAKLSTEELEKMRVSKEFSDFSMYIDGIIKSKKHLLSEKEEALLAQVKVFSGEFRNTFSMFDNVDADFGTMEIDGQTRKITHGLYSVLLQSRDVKTREKAYNSVYKAYGSMLNTLASNYAGNVKQTYFWSKARKYDGCLDMALFATDIPVKVYDNLISAVKKATPILHKYVALRKKALKLDAMHMYDMYVPIVGEDNTLTSYDEAYDIVLDALKPLGEGYCKTLKEARENGWIDVLETKNKKSGAYSWGCYGVHPYVLLNHSGTLHDVFTVAHEMGHAMHSFYSNKSQSFEKCGYGIFIAEIASTVNEVLLIKHLLKTAEGEKRAYLLSYFADTVRTTLFRQTMFAEFERFAHETVEKGEALTAEKMTDFYRKLNAQYYGKAVVTDENIGYEWSRIPHFYRDFYVYQYATGLTCAINIAEKILADKSVVDDYIKFLSAGGSIYPIDTLKIMGIDLTQSAPFERAMEQFESAVDELDKYFDNKAVSK